jgi:phosphatidate phosphatase LPIN
VRLTTSSNLALRPPADARREGGGDDDDDYLWEWGAFPQRSPAREVFPGAGAGARGIEAVMWPPSGDEPPADDGGDGERRWKRSRSVPREPEYERAPEQQQPPRNSPPQRGRMSVAMPSPEMVFGAGGRLLPERRDPTRFRLSIEGRRVWFELSVVPVAARARAHGSRKGVLGSWGEVEAALEFDRGKVAWRRFLDDERVLADEGLVIRWADDKCVSVSHLRLGTGSNGAERLPAQVHHARGRLAADAGARPVARRGPQGGGLHPCSLAHAAARGRAAIVGRGAVVVR